MLLNLSLVFAICYFIEIAETHNLPKISNKKYAVAKNREELINIIRSLKYYQDELNNINESDTDLTDEEKEKKLQNILWLLKKNYKAQKHFDFLHNNRFHTTSRLHFIKNPSVLEEYKKNLKKIRRFPKTNSTKNINQQNNLKNKLRNMRRDAMFRLGSSESYSEDIDKKEEKKKVNVRTSNQPYNPVKKTQNKEKAQVLKKDIFVEYPETKDTLELHDTNVHNSLRSDYDFRREKSKWDERFENSNNVEESRNIKNKYRNQPTLKKKKIESDTVNWDKITTKDYSIMYKKKKTPKESEYNIKESKYNIKESEYKIKPSYKRPKNDNMNKDFYSYGRTPIPFVGKRGIYDEK